jgi:hypothetical protein
VGLFIHAFAATTKKVPDAPEMIIGYGAEYVRPGRHAVPTEEVDTDEDRLDEERKALEDERKPEHLAVDVDQARPEDRHLERQQRAPIRPRPQTARP